MLVWQSQTQHALQRSGIVNPGMCNDWLLLICNMNINTIQESMYKIFHACEVCEGDKQD